MHVPVPPTIAEEMGHPRCVFVTGGPSAYLAGINCIASRLLTLRSAYPLLVVVEEEEEAHMRQHVRSLAAPSRVVAWRHFPTSNQSTWRSKEWQFRAPHVMDKLNVFGLPFQRVVWLDADMFIARSIDELCNDLPANITFAAALDAREQLISQKRRVAEAPRNCWKNGMVGTAALRSSCPQSCPREMPIPSTFQMSVRASDAHPPQSQCPYILNTGVMVVRPFEPPAFNARIVEPMLAKRVKSYDGGDQGVVATFIFHFGLFGAHEYARLHARYNVHSKNIRHAADVWPAAAGGPVIVHHMRENRPWLRMPEVGNHTQNARWEAACGGEVCALQAQSTYRRGWFSAKSMSPRKREWVEGAWVTHCARKANETSGAGSAGSGR